jgi:protein-arginine deiminase
MSSQHTAPSSVRRHAVLSLAIAVALLCAPPAAVAQADEIFADGFESGDSTAWSRAQGLVVPPFSDLRADVNRNGTVDLDDPSEDVGEDGWDADHGAIFLANIDDDQSACPSTGSDEQLASCHDAADEIINGASDLDDLARLMTVPWPQAPDAASGAIVVPAPAGQFVRLFKRTGASFEVFDPHADVLSADDLRTGVELAIEGIDLVRDASVWDGFVDITLEVDSGSAIASDTVRFRLAPVIFRHHLHEIETAYATDLESHPGSLEFRTDLQAALTAAGVAEPLFEIFGYPDQWTQDHFETTYMSMPSPQGQHVIHVNFRMPEHYAAFGGLRHAGRVVFTHLRGPDVAGAVHYDPTHPDWMNSLNMGGNLETIPPFTHGGIDWPQGRVVHGGTANFHPDPIFDALINAQGQQSVVYIDTSWLFVGHIDETMSFVKASSPRGWVTVIADPAEAWAMFGDLQAAGHGQVPMFVGLTWWDGTPAGITIDQVLADPDLANDNAWAAVEVAAQIDQLRAITGIDDSELVSAPFLFSLDYDGMAAYQPGLVNGIVISDSVFGAPETHGPSINGEDPFKTRFETNLAAHGFSVQWIENWDLYHTGMGEVHCGSNARRHIPTDQPWWEVAR